MAILNNYRNIHAPIDQGTMDFAKQQFASDDSAGRNAYQLELANQLRANTYQNPESIWNSIRTGQQNAVEAQQTQQTQELNDFIDSAPQQPIEDPTGRLSVEEKQGSVWVPVEYSTSGDNATTYYGEPITIEQLRAAGKAPSSNGQWQQYVFSPGGDAGGSFYAPYVDYSDPNQASNSGGG